MELVAADVTYLDPEGCNSTAGYTITTSKAYLEATIDLADCTRKIQWSFYGGTPIDKVDRAIALLMDFRKVYAKQLKKFEKEEAEREAKKKTEKSK